MAGNRELLAYTQLAVSSQEPGVTPTSLGYDPSDWAAPEGLASFLAPSISVSGSSPCY